MLDDLTIKPRPRTELVKTTPKSKCVVCCRMYQKAKLNQKTCSRLCYQSLALARQRVKARRARGLSDLTLPTALCVVCGSTFEQRQQNYVCCGKPECKKGRAKQSYEAWKLPLRQLKVEVPKS